MPPAIILTPALNLICERRPVARRPHRRHMKNEAKQIYKNFRDATAALIDWPGTPRAVHEVVAKMVEEFGNELDGASDFDGDHAHRVMSNVFDLRDEGAAPRPTLAEYDPEIEARRADYERLAEALAFMTEMSGNRRWYDLDIEIKGIDTGDERNGLQLIGAIHDHLLALWDHLDWHDARTMRRFYVELRLHADQGAIERRRAYEEFQKQEVRKEAP